MKILIVDDNRTDRKLLRAQLEKGGHETREAADGKEALTFLAGETFDALISDILMPNMDGYGLCIEIRKNKKLIGLPVILYSATYVSAADEKLAQDAGADRYMRKPAQTQVLLDALAESIAERKKSPRAARPSKKAGDVMKEYSQRLIQKVEDKNLELERVNKSLRESEGKYHELVEHLPLVVYTSELGVTGVWAYVSPEIEGLLGFTPEEWMADPTLWNRQVHPADRDHQQRLEEQAYANGQPFESEYRIFTKDGREIWVRDSGHTLNREAGQAPLVQGVLVDVSERKRAEEVLYRTNQSLKIIIEAAPLAMISFNLDGVVRSWNPAAERVLGWKESEVLGRLAPHIGEAHLAEFHSLHEKVVQGQTLHALELPREKKDGTPILVSLSTAPLYEPSGALGGYMVILEDITERKQAQEKLRNSEERYRHLVENSSDQISIMTADGGLLYESPSANSLLGYPAGHFVGQDLFQLIHPADVEHVQAQFARLAQNADLHPREEFRLRHTDGTWHWVEAVGTNLLAEPSVGGIVINYHDITERKQAQEKSQKRFAEINAIYESAQHLQKLFSPQDLSAEIIQTLENVLRYEYCAVLLVDEDSKYLIPFAISAQGRDADFGAQDKEYILAHQPQVGQGITGWVAEHGQSLRLGDVTQDSRYYGMHADIRSELCVPLWSGDKVIGVVNTESVRPDAYTEDDQRVLETVAAQIAIAIQNARLLESEHTSRQQIEVIASATAALVHTLELETVLETLLDYAAKIIPYDSANVHLFDDSEALSLRALRGYERFTDPQGLRAVRFKLSETPVLAELAASKQGMIIEDTRQRADWVLVPGTEYVIGWLGVPLIAGGEFIGIYSMDATEAGRFTAEHLRLAEALGAQAAVAVRNARLLEETRQSHTRLAEVSRRLVDVHESEQRAIGRELHDQFGQILTALKLTLEIAPQLPPESAQKKYAQAQELVQDLLTRVSSLTLELRPPMLDDLGLIPALLWHVNRFEEQSGLKVDFKHSNVEGRRFESQVESTAYRIVQEAFTNIARHAQATHVRLAVRATHNELIIEVSDDGRGFNPQQALAEKRSSGLSGMSERARLLGGTFRIESQIGRGTRKFIRLPLEQKSA